MNDKAEKSLDVQQQLYEGNRAPLSSNSDALTQDSILKHHAECKLDNKLRLKEVKNLEELIHF
jgi:hypothetical protein